MTFERQRIAIQEGCGWKLGKEPRYPHRKALLKDGNYILIIDLPEYESDLNAMHEAEQFLNGLQQGEYAAELDKLAFTNLHEDFALIHATAAQRAEAFLRTIGKWEDEAK